MGKWKHWSWAQNTVSLSDMAEAKMGSGGRNTSEEPVEENKGEDRHVLKVVLMSTGHQQWG